MNKHGRPLDVSSTNSIVCQTTEIHVQPRQILYLDNHNKLRSISGKFKPRLTGQCRVGGVESQSLQFQSSCKASQMAVCPEDVQCFRLSTRRHQLINEIVGTHTNLVHRNTGLKTNHLAGKGFITDYTEYRLSPQKLSLGACIELFHIGDVFRSNVIITTSYLTSHIAGRLRQINFKPLKEDCRSYFFWFK